MNIQGSRERVLDSVLPHEITHMIFASHFRRPLPRWADEGGATSVEHVSEKQKHRVMLVQFLRTGHGIAFDQMFAMTEYPADVMPLYAQGYSLAEFLIFKGGRRRFVDFLGDGMQSGQWSEAIQRNYGITDLSALQNTWVAWVAQGFPPPPNEVIASSLSRPEATTAAVSQVDNHRARPEANLIYHVRDKGPQGAAPNGSGDPTTSARPDGAAYSPGSAMSAMNAPPGDAQSMPPVGWRPSSQDGAGVTLPPPPSPPITQGTTTEVARPPTVEAGSQVLLEWNQQPK
jgi:hypothetical protein